MQIQNIKINFKQGAIASITPLKRGPVVRKVSDGKMPAPDFTEKIHRFFDCEYRVTAYSARSVWVRVYATD